jgi:hypothetical protein
VARNQTQNGRAEVRDATVRVDRVERRPEVREVRERFGGLDLPASLVGMLTGLASVALLGGLVGAAIGAVGYQTGVDGDDVAAISVAGLAGGIVVLCLAYLLGGWAAGRIARYDGVRNGVLTGVWTLVLAAGLSGLAAWLGAEYDVLRGVDMPQWFSTDALTVGGIVSALAAIAAMLVGGALGGAWGERYHRRADAAVLATREGGVAHERERRVVRASGERGR